MCPTCSSVSDVDILNVTVRLISSTSKRSSYVNTSHISNRVSTLSTDTKNVRLDKLTNSNCNMKHSINDLTHTTEFCSIHMLVTHSAIHQVTSNTMILQMGMFICT